MWATLVSKVGLSCELPVLVGCWAVVWVSSVVTGVPFAWRGRRGGDCHSNAIYRSILQTLSTDCVDTLASRGPGPWQAGRIVAIERHRQLVLSHCAPGCGSARRHAAGLWRSSGLRRLRPLLDDTATRT